MNQDGELFSCEKQKEFWDFNLEKCGSGDIISSFIKLWSNEKEKEFTVTRCDNVH